MIKKINDKKSLSSLPAHCVWGLVCSMAAIDQQSNNLSLFNVIDQFNIPKDAFEEVDKNKSALALPIPHEIVMLWRRKIDASIDGKLIELDVSVSLKDPTNQIIQTILTKLEIKSGTSLTRFRMQTNALLITTPGSYWYSIGVKRIEEELFQPAFEIPFLVKER